MIIYRFFLILSLLLLASCEDSYRSLTEADHIRDIAIVSLQVDTRLHAMDGIPLLEDREGDFRLSFSDASYLYGFFQRVAAELSESQRYALRLPFQFKDNSVFQQLPEQYDPLYMTSIPPSKSLPLDDAVISKLLLSRLEGDAVARVILRFYRAFASENSIVGDGSGHLQRSELRAVMEFYIYDADSGAYKAIIEGEIIDCESLTEENELLDSGLEGGLGDCILESLAGLRPALSRYF